MGQSRSDRREREKEQRRQDILDAALNLFARRGFHNVAMQEVAEAAGFAVGTLYNFFANKDSLFEELHQRSAKQLLEALLDTLRGQGSTVERLRRFVQRQPEILLEHGDFIRLYVAAVGQRVNKLCAEQQNHAFREVLDAELARIIQGGIDQGVFRRVDARLTAMALVSTMETLAFEDAGSLNEKQLREAFTQVEILFIDGLLLSGNSTHE